MLLSEEIFGIFLPRKVKLFSSLSKIIMLSFKRSSFIMSPSRKKGQKNLSKKREIKS